MKILHVFRSPVGGLFRHVRDLVLGQQALGHHVGIFCDSLTGGPSADAALQDLEKLCALGVYRHAIPSLPGAGDFLTSRSVAKLSKQLDVDILHGHGAKGGAYARLAARSCNVPSVYTPHGGSLHHGWSKASGIFYLTAEKLLRLKNTGLVFVCEFERALYDQKIGLGSLPNTVVYNGLWPEDFEARQLRADAADLLFVGEMRELKGVDVLLHALALLPATSRPSLNLVGDGADLGKFESLSQNLGLASHVKFLGRMGFKQASEQGRILVLPSRHESFPYVVIEAVAAGLPVIASNVGGIAEALPPSCMVTADDAPALAALLQAKLAEPGELTQLAKALRVEAMRRFSAEVMTKAICDFYTQMR